MMLDQMFMRILDMSGAASVVILVVLAARLLLKKAPKVISYALWAVVLLRLLCPFTIEAPVAIVSDTLSVSDHYELADEPISFAGAGIAAYHAIGDALNGGLGVQHIPTTEKDVEGNTVYVTSDWYDVWILFGQYVWAAGIAAMAAYSAISNIRLRNRLVVTVPLRENIYIADDIGSPFVIGFLRPKIYLPAALNEKEQEYIILHEQHHVHRLDHIWKLLGFLALTVHWFNPLVWLAFVLFCRDMEMSCDEAVIGKLGEHVRADYSASLLTLATGKRIIGGTPLAFGEGDPKGRIRNLAKWKKPSVWVVAVAAVLCCVLAVCLITSRAGDQGANPSGITLYYGTVAELTDETLILRTEDGNRLEFRLSESCEPEAGVGDYAAVRCDTGAIGDGAVVTQVTAKERIGFASRDDAVIAAILDKNSSGKKEGDASAASFVLLANEAGGPAETDGEPVQYETVYGLALHQTYSKHLGSIREEGGSHVPVAITVIRTGSGEYVVSEYWEPRDGNLYGEDIRAKFPAGVDPDTRLYIERQQRECLEQAVELFGLEGALNQMPEDTLPAEPEETEPEDGVYHPQRHP